MKEKEKTLFTFTFIIAAIFLLYLGYLYKVKIDLIDQHGSAAVTESIKEDDSFSVIMYKTYRDSVLR